MHSKHPILTAIHQNLLLLDGGMGTLLQQRGLMPGEMPEEWNLSHPRVIRDIHEAYLAAGTRLICANTFGVNGLKYSEAQTEALVLAAIANAREAISRLHLEDEAFVALDIGPGGRLLAPLGDLDFEDAVSAFALTVKAGVKAGADCIFIETMNDSYETKAAVLAAKENCDLPIFVSCAYGADGKLMTGASPEAMVAMLEGLGVDAMGVNCSLGPEALSDVVRRYLAASSLPILFKPNAGLPRVEKGETVYDITPAEFALQVKELAEAGVRMVGGCCGTTPAHIAALRDALRDVTPKPIAKKAQTVISSYTHALSFEGKPVLIGERINPTGKKRFQQALREGDLDYLMQEGIRQADAGVDALDVNVGLPGVDESDMLLRTVKGLQAICDLPLQIDTADPIAMEAALRIYNGKPLINSVSGKAESMAAVFPLAKKYGGAIIALTLDESGIPKTARGRVEIARRILQTAEAYGIEKRDLIFDPLAMAISADEGAAVQTLKAVEMIRSELGCHVSLGVSNVSFGLPMRDYISASFFTLALQNGLSAAILNPHSAEMMKAYRTYLALSGQDAHCEGYIAYASTLVQNAPATAQAAPTAAPTKSAPSQAGEDAEGLRTAIIKGMKERAVHLTESLMSAVPGMTLVETAIMPALDEVGAGFEKGKVYLPQLLMSADAASGAFGVIRAGMQKAGEGQSEKRAVFVLATVKGDVHDIGKNIVKLLLENYGFDVRDLGKDVPPEAILQAVLDTHAPLCGLSALMTTTVPAMEQTIALLHEQAPFCKIVVGGAVLNAEYAKRIGADAYGADAMETVRYAEQIASSLQD